MALTVLEVAGGLRHRHGAVIEIEPMLPQSRDLPEAKAAPSGEKEQRLPSFRRGEDEFVAHATR